MFDYSESVRRAVEICGDQKKLATIVNATVEDIASWMQGRRPPPLQLMRILDLLHEHRQHAAKAAAETASPSVPPSSEQ